jgi:hypothetical protein
MKTGSRLFIFPGIMAVISRIAAVDRLARPLKFIMSQTGEIKASKMTACIVTAGNVTP